MVLREQGDDHHGQDRQKAMLFCRYTIIPHYFISSLLKDKQNGNCTCEGFVLPGEQYVGLMTLSCTIRYFEAVISTR